MTSNVGGMDKIARIVVGLALIAFALLGPATIGWKWIGWIGVVPLLTGFFNLCPAYTLLGINTCKIGK
jgi:fatty acid desaturase